MFEVDNWVEYRKQKIPDKWKNFFIVNQIGQFSRFSRCVSEGIFFTMFPLRKNF